MSRVSKTHTEKISAEIADAILRGEFRPGSRLEEERLSQQFGVSRTPVREALRQLTASGLVESRPRRGTVVASFTLPQLETLFGAMAELEATCARLSAISMSQVERRRLGAVHQAMAELVERGDTESYAEENQRFHSLIYEGSHNSVLIDFATGVRRRLAPFRRAQFRMPGRLPRSYAEHAEVVKSILAADAAAAHAAMLHHVSLIEDAFDRLAESEYRPD